MKNINLGYVKQLENKIEKIKSVVDLAEKWSRDQSNGISDCTLCISAMKDIRRHLKDN